MKEFTFPAEYFNASDTLNCGQIFRFTEIKDGFRVLTKDKCALIKNAGDLAIITCEDKDAEYFTRFFDLDRDYSWSPAAATSVLPTIPLSFRKDHVLQTERRLRPAGVEICK